MKLMNFLPTGVVALAFMLVGCGPSGTDGQTDDSSAAAGKYTILGTLTDQFDRVKGKANVEDTLSKYPDIDCMVGLFAYNPPLMLEALDQAGKLGQVKVVAFDEADETLQGIIDGTVYGTVVQNPYMYGYKSVEVLKQIVAGDESVIPESKFIDIPARNIKQENVQAFWDDLKSKVSGGGGAEAPAVSPEASRIAFVSNGVASFWTIAQRGVEQAGADLGVHVSVHMPAEGISDQKRIIEDLLTRGVDGVAVSPIDPENQTDLLNAAAEKTKLITHDSDAPEANRLLYIGMDNYAAGRMCGALVKEAMPDGGRIMIFIGRLEQDNARRRRQGVIDEILGRSHDPNRTDPPDAVLTGG